MQDTQQLTVGGIIQNGFLTGLRNAASLVGAVALWALTIWIPYLNVGTTIGLLGLIAAMSKGDVISPTAIFRKEYRKQMGEFFLVQAFIAIGVTIGLMFLVIPGIVIAMAWGFAPLLVIDRGMNPTEALQKSNDLTSGKKWIIFIGAVLTVLATEAAVVLLVSLFNAIHWSLAGLIGLAGLVLIISVAMGTQAHIYGVITGSAPAPQREVNQPLMIGGAIGVVVLAIGVVSLVTALTNRSREEELTRQMREYERPATTSYKQQRGDEAQDVGEETEEPRRGSRVAPTFADEEEQPVRKVANNRQKKRTRTP
jgi:hypothetical protein